MKLLGRDSGDDEDDEDEDDEDEEGEDEDEDEDEEDDGRVSECTDQEASGCVCCRGGQHCQIRGHMPTA